MAIGDVRFRITESGYRELLAKAKENELFGPPYRSGMEHIKETAVTSVTAGAPIGSTGHTVQNISGTMSHAPIPRFVRVTESALSPKGFPYPRILEFSPYAQSRYKTGTNRHRYWMRQAIERVVPVIDRIFDDTADAVERRWAS